MKLSALQAEQTGKFWTDEVSLDRLLIERNRCPKCKKGFIYRGVSNKDEYHAYGMCEKCDVAELFWKESPAFANTKKAFSKQTAAV